MKKVLRAMILASIYAAIGVLGLSAQVPAQSEPASPYPIVEGLAPSQILLSADSWDKLVAAAKPSFTEGQTLIWARDEGGTDTVAFEFATPFGYRTTEGQILWAIAAGPPESNDLISRQDYDIRPHGLAPVVAGKSGHRCDGCGVPDYAMVVPAKGIAGTVYEIGFEGVMNMRGSGHVLNDKLFYVLKDNDRRFRIIGAVQGEGSGKLGQRECYSFSTAMREVVPNPQSPLGLEIRFTTKETTAECPRESPEGVLRLDRVEYQDFVIGGSSSSMQPREHPYLIAEAGDTTDAIVHLLATWNWNWDNSGCHDALIEKQRHSRIEQQWRQSLLQLNPGLGPGALEQGTRLYIPSDGADIARRFDLGPLRTALNELPDKLKGLAVQEAAIDSSAFGGHLSVGYTVSGGGFLGIDGEVHESAAEAKASFEEEMCGAFGMTKRTIQELTVYEIRSKLEDRVDLALQIEAYIFSIFGPQGLTESALSVLAMSPSLRTTPKGEGR